MIARLRSEDGFTVVMAMMVMLVGLLFATAAIGQAISTESSVRRDGASKRALQAARAGVETNRYRMTALAERTMAPDGSPLCPAPDGAGNITFVAPVGSWCPPVTAAVGAGETATTWVSTDTEPARAMTDARDIVARGVSADGIRRVRTSWMVFDIRRLFLDYAVFSDEDLNLSNQGDIGAPDVQGNARSNGNINLNHSNTNIYGNATPGPGAKVTGQGGVHGSRDDADEKLLLPAVDLTDARASNDNAALCGGTCPANLRIDLGTTRVIEGNTYLVCSLSLSGQGNPTITFTPADPTQPITFFIETPENCGGTGGTVFDVANNPNVVVSHPAFPSIQVLIAGSSTIATSASVNNRNWEPSLPITLYAPNSSVTIQQHSALDGGVAARAVTMLNHSKVVQDSQPVTLDLEVPPEVTAGDFVECRPRFDESAPMEGC